MASSSSLRQDVTSQQPSSYSTQVPGSPRAFSFITSSLLSTDLHIEKHTEGVAGVHCVQRTSILAVNLWFGSCDEAVWGRQAMQADWCL